MKRFILYFALLLATLLCMPHLLFGDENNDGDPIPIQYNGNEEGDDNKNRSIASVPIEATYYRLQDYVHVSFLENIGDVSIRLTNITTSSITYRVIDSSYGTSIIPIMNGSGYYEICFVTDCGQYIGLFMVE